MKYLAGVATLRLDAEKCTGCGRCIQVCPRSVFELRDRKAVIVDRDRCIECGACRRNCEFGALSVDAGVGCAQALFNAMLTGGEPVCGCGGEGEGKGSACC
jgi:NAD-dependent dihydropyrimidine dehydrogenase PreA subunit